MNTKLAVLLIPVLAACSSARSSAVSINVATSEYENWTCKMLADEQMRLSIAMTIGSPESKAVRVADQRREYDSITQAMNKKECDGPTPIVAGIS
jgi:hypothetical protein